MRRSVLRRLLATLVTVSLLLLVLAPAAFATALSGGLGDGQGTYGAADDKVVTNAGFMIIAFFPLFILVMSLLQWRLDKRKYARRAAAKRRASGAEWHGGW
jgi:hypothetical protein